MDFDFSVTIIVNIRVFNEKAIINLLSLFNLLYFLYSSYKNLNIYASFLSNKYSYTYYIAQIL